MAVVLKTLYNETAPQIAQTLQTLYSETAPGVAAILGQLGFAALDLFL